MARKWKSYLGGHTLVNAQRESGWSLERRLTFQASRIQNGLRRAQQRLDDEARLDAEARQRVFESVFEPRPLRRQPITKSKRPTTTKSKPMLSVTSVPVEHRKITERFHKAKRPKLGDK